MISMGIDASTTSTGWCVFDGQELVDYGVVKPEGSDWRARLIAEGSALQQVIEKHLPKKIYIEDVPQKKTNVSVLMKLGAVQGFLLGVVSRYNISIEFIYPGTWRSKVGLFDGTQKGKERDEMKHKSILKANELFGLNLKWVSPSSTKNEDDIADSILLCYSQVKPRKFGK